MLKKFGYDAEIKSRALLKVLAAARRNRRLDCSKVSQKLWNGIGDEDDPLKLCSPVFFSYKTCR